jgi:hypothetical protein
MARKWAYAPCRNVGAFDAAFGAAQQGSDRIDADAGQPCEIDLAQTQLASFPSDHTGEVRADGGQSELSRRPKSPQGLRPDLERRVGEGFFIGDEVTITLGVQLVKA